MDPTCGTRVGPFNTYTIPASLPSYPPSVREDIIACLCRYQVGGSAGQTLLGYSCGFGIISALTVILLLTVDGRNPAPPDLYKTL